VVIDGIDELVADDAEGGTMLPSTWMGSKDDTADLANQPCFVLTCSEVEVQKNCLEALGASAVQRHGELQQAFVDSVESALGRELSQTAADALLYLCEARTALSVKDLSSSKLLSKNQKLVEKDLRDLISVLHVHHGRYTLKHRRVAAKILLVAAKMQGDETDKIAEIHKRLYRFYKQKSNGHISASGDDSEKTLMESKYHRVRANIPDSGVVVAMRVRPLGNREKGDVPSVTVVGNSTLLEHPKGTHVFKFDYSFDSMNAKRPRASQERVYKLLGKDLVTNATQGYNVCLFAYGQTGSGKTHSMFGPQMGGMSGGQAGLIPRICAELFDRLNAKEGSMQGLEHSVDVMMLEIYKDKVYDLLKSGDDVTGTDRDALRLLWVNENLILQAKDGNNWALFESQKASTAEELNKSIEQGYSMRATKSTHMNDRSSRSHCIVMLHVTQTYEGSVSKSKVNLVDLAGSERADTSKGASKEVLAEAIKVNESLSILNKCIQALSTSGRTRKTTHAPFRDSKLTMILRVSP
jgi:hypothetical protein